MSRVRSFQHLSVCCAANKAPKGTLVVPVISAISRGRKYSSSSPNPRHPVWTHATRRRASLYETLPKLIATKTLGLEDAMNKVPGLPGSMCHGVNQRISR